MLGAERRVGVVIERDGGSEGANPPGRSRSVAAHPGNGGLNFLALAALVGSLVAIGFGLDPGTRLRALRGVAVVVLSSFPAFLYIRFSEARGPAIWNEYVYNLKRLGVDTEPNLPPTLEDLVSGKGDEDEQRTRNIYVQKFDAHYGTQNRLRWQAGRQAELERRSLLKVLDTLVPVVLATVIVTVGWLATLLAPGLYGSASDHLVDALRLGFLGSYLFIIQMLIRRYFQNDLKGTAYLAAAARMIVVPILVAVLHAVFTLDHPWERALAFLVGIFPLLALRAINAIVSKFLKNAVPSLEMNYPLSDLDGMTIWYEARLLEEGIEDMQSLVTANIVDVMLATRIPVGRLVDWLDQASLYLHMEPVERSGLRRRNEHGDSAATAAPDRWRMRRFGVRCATDLEDVFAPAPGGGLEPYWHEGSERVEFLTGLKQLLATDGPSATVSILRSLRRDPALDLARNWKGCKVGPDDAPLDLRETSGAQPDGFVDAAVPPVPG